MEPDDKVNESNKQQVCEAVCFMHLVVVVASLSKHDPWQIEKLK